MSRILDALHAHALGNIGLHKANIEIYLKNPAGIGEHSDIVEAVQKELTIMGHAHERLEMLDKYFDE